MGSHPDGTVAATAADDAASRAFTTTWRRVAGVSGFPKHPQVASGPPRASTTETKTANAAYDAARSPKPSSRSLAK